MKDKVKKLLSTKVLSFPLYLYKYRVALDISDEDFILLVYLINIDEPIIFDASAIAEDLGIPMEDVFERVERLKEKKLINIKSESRGKDEHIFLNLLYDRLLSIFLEDKVEDAIYNEIEDALARPLSSIEVEFISSWLEKGFSSDIIMEAVKEAVLNGVTNLKYINKILYEWDKKGVKTPKDIKKAKKEYYQKNEEIKDIFDYDWLDE